MTYNVFSGTLNVTLSIYSVVADAVYRLIYVARKSL